MKVIIILAFALFVSACKKEVVTPTPTYCFNIVKKTNIVYVKTTSKGVEYETDEYTLRVDTLDQVCGLTIQGASIYFKPYTEVYNAIDPIRHQKYYMMTETDPKRVK